MSELIEVHQLDYKACSLTYGEGACTAQAGTRPAGYGVAVFNGSTSNVSTAPLISDNTDSYKIAMDFAFSDIANLNILYHTQKTSDSSQIRIYLNESGPAHFVNILIKDGASQSIGSVAVPNMTADTFYGLSVELQQNGSNTDCTVTLDNTAYTTVSVPQGLNDYDTAHIGSIGGTTNLSFDGKIKNYKELINDVVTKDIDFNNNVNDQAGNTTPTATDVTFETVCPDLVRDVASFNGSTSKVELGSPYGLAGPNNWEVSLKFFYDGNDGVLYSEYSAGGTFNGVKVQSNQIRLKLGNTEAGITIDTPLLNTFINLTLKQVSRVANVATIEVTINGVTSSFTIVYGTTTLTGSSIGYGPFFGVGYYSGKIYDFYIKDQNGVLVRDLPLATDATDQTGNSTPIATSVSFVSQALSGVDPDNPNLCALVPDPNKKCFNTYATCQDRPNYLSTTKTLTFTKQNSALPKESGSTVGFFPSITNSSTQSAELNVGARRFDLNTLGKSSSASITMTDAPYSDNLTDPYVLERTYNPLERGTFWGKFLAQNPYYSGDEYRIYTGEAGQNISVIWITSGI